MCRERDNCRPDNLLEQCFSTGKEDVRVTILGLPSPGWVEDPNSRMEEKRKNQQIRTQSTRLIMNNEFTIIVAGLVISLITCVVYIIYKASDEDFWY